MMRSCCQHATSDGELLPRRSSWWRCGAAAVKWIVPGATLVLLPKCPACVVAYVTLLTGTGISLANASTLRVALLILCLSTLAVLTLKLVTRWIRARRPAR